MADKDPNLSKSELDDELDLPDFDDSMLDGNPGKDRKPIERITGGFYEGVKRTALNSNTRRQVIDRALPKGYGKAYGDALSSVDLGQELYDTAKENIVPVKRDLKKIGRYVASKTESILPEAIQKKLEELTKPEDSSTDVLEKVDRDKLTMNAAVQEVFGDFMTEQSERNRSSQEARLKGEVRGRNILGAQLDLQYRRDQREEQTKLRQEATGEARYRTETNLLNMMRSGVERLVDYQDRITASYQRKSLELQYRQFFVARDHYSLFQSYVKQTDEQLDAITKNSALPDFLKIRTSETASSMLRQRALGRIGGFVEKKTGGFQQKLKDKLSGVTQNFAEGVRGASDTLDMVSDVPIDRAELGGDVAGGLVAENGMAALAKKLGMRLGKNESVSRLGNNLEYYSDNKSEMARDWLTNLKDREYREDGTSTVGDSIKASLAEMALGLMPGQSPEATYGRDASDLAEEAGVYTSLADKSITEIIPGLLTDLLHETEMMRTQDPTLDRRVYDYESGEVRRQSEVQKKLVERTLPAGRMASIRDDLTSIVDKLDTQDELPESARLAFTRQLLTDASKNRRFDPERYFSPQGLSEVEDEEDLVAIRNLIKGRFLREDGKFRKHDTKATSARNASARVYNSAKDDIPSYQETIGKLMPLYGARTLREAGLIEQEDRAGETRANVSNILDYINTGESPSPTSEEGGSSDAVSDPRRAFGPDTTQSDMSAGRDRTGGDAGVDSGGLDRVVGILERFVDVQQSVDPRRQFANVLDAIAKINPLKHLELNGQWLKDIYELLRNALGGPDGPSGGPSGPQDGPPKDFSKSRWARPIPQFNQQSTQRKSRWNRNQSGSLRESMSELKENGVTSMAAYRQRMETQRTRAQEGSLGLQMASGDGFTGNGGDSGTLGTQFTESTRSSVSSMSDRRQGVGDDLSNRLSSLGDSMTRSNRIESDDVRSSLPQGREAINDPRYSQAVRDVVTYLEGKLPDAGSVQSSVGGKLSALKAGAGNLSDRTQSTLSDMLGRTQDLGERVRSRSADMMTQLSDKTEQTSTLSQDFLGKVVDRVRDRLATTVESAPTGGAAGDVDESGGGDDYWTRARGLVQEILTHMDRKTEQLQETLENLTLAQMAGDSNDPGMLKRLGRGAASGLGGIMSFYGGIWKSAGNLAAGGTGMLRNLAGKMFQGKGQQGDGIMDIYIKGHKRPAMLARDLRAGRYFDQESGDVVQRLDEITGPVVDSNGDVVISEYDIDEGLLVNGEGKSVMDRLGSVVGGLTSYMTSPYRLAFGGAKKVLDIGKNWMNKPRDVYVKGEQTPRLMAVVMKNNGYLSQAAGKVIRSIKDIDGAVVDRQGNVVLTLEDMRLGLTDNRGRAIKGLLKGAGRLATGTVKGVSKYVTGTWKATGRVLKGAASLIPGVGKKGESGGGGGKKQTQLLQEIRDLLDDRLKKPLRKGGWRSQLYGDTPKALPAPSGGIAGKGALAAAGGGLGGMLKKMFGLGGGEGEGGGLGLDVGADIDIGGGERRGPRPRRRPRGRMGRMFQGIKSMGGKAIRGLGTAARFAIPTAAAAIPGIAAAAGTAASAAGGLLAGLGTAIAGIVSAPVLLAGAAVAAVGVGAYFAYQHFARKPDGPLHRVRLAQYGADPDNKDHVGKISGLEEAMGDQVQFDGKRLASLGSGIDLEEAIDDFGVDTDDEVAVSRWLTWFQERFKPVYLSHAVVAKDMIDSSDLTDTEDMDDALKRTYLRRTQFKGNQKPYGSVSPFEDMDALPGDAKVEMELTKALKTLPPATKGQQMDEAAEAEIERSNGRTPSILPDVSTGPNPSQTQKVMSVTSQQALNGRPMRSPQRPSLLAANGSAVAINSVQSGAINRSTGPVSMSEIPTEEQRLAAESAAVIQGRQTPGAQEATDRVESQRVKQEKVARQTAVQSAAASTRMVSEMQRVASILSASHTTQVSMDTSLKNIDAYFSKLREDEEDRQRRGTTASDRSSSNWTGGDGDRKTIPPAGLRLRRN